MEEICGLRSPVSLENSIAEAKVKTGKRTQLLIGGIYRLLESSLKSLEKCKSTLATAVSTNYEIIIICDLNFDLIQ